VHFRTHDISLRRRRIVTAIAGHFRFGSRFEPGRSCAAMLDAQSCYGPHDRAQADDGDIALGRNLYRLLPEDIHDRQPLRSGPLLLVADVRIDNRDELLGALGAVGANLSDAALLLQAFERWGQGVLDRVAGDFAFAVWNSRDRELTLARDPLGQRPLHYHRGDGFFAFASMPAGLHALDGIPREPDEEKAAQFVADLFPSGPRSYFRGILRVEPGHVVTVTRESVSTRRYWQPRRSELRLPRMADYVEAFREQIDRATGAMLRGGGELVASHLSAGYDSSAVTATAARLLAPEGRRLLAFTAAPREGFDGPVPRGRIADESRLAATTAAMHPNIDHVVIRPSGTSPFALLDAKHPLVQQPAGHICNGVWGTAIKEAAKARGASVLLIGQIGNYTISAGGRGQLADLVRQGRMLRWWREARAMVAKSPMRWRGVFDNSFGPWLPLPLYELLSRGFRGASPSSAKPSLLSAAWAGRMAQRPADSFRDPRPGKDSAELAISLLHNEDSGNFRKASIAAWGIDERDPTGDRRLIDFCLSLPTEMLLRDGEKRPLARAALADRLPAEVLDLQDRGYQMADWYEQITPELVAAEAERLARCEAAAGVVDFNHVRAMIDAWPSGGWDRQWVISEYRAGLLRALSAAHFLGGARV
jgi:asparagine synthase (glutamine-hydrolysing)